MQEEHLVQFMECNQLSYQPIDKELQDELGDDLFQASGVTKEQSFYRVPWLEAVELVKSRRVLVRGGWAFIPESELLSLVVGVFRSGPVYCLPPQFLVLFSMLCIRNLRFTDIIWPPS